MLIIVILISTVVSTIKRLNPPAGHWTTEQKLYDISSKTVINLDEHPEKKPEIRKYNTVILNGEKICLNWEMFRAHINCPNCAPKVSIVHHLIGINHLNGAQSMVCQTCGHSFEVGGHDYDEETLRMLAQAKLSQMF